mmetsp:Transcript_57628/g.160582  ORF Transcript_57628/g.160582 Transcript_57628/m.160582 type:complete len:849 (-) Transcript_57628:24-2570(-)
MARPTAAADLPIFVTIPSAETGRGLLGQSPSLYVVEVEAFGLRSEVRHTFESFEKFHAELNQFISHLPSEVRKKLSYALPPLPPTYMFGNEMSATVEDRRVKLEVFMQKLLLQKEIVGDTEGRLWRFLQLHSAASAAASLLTTRSYGSWLRSLWEASTGGEGLVPLQHPAVEQALLHVVRNTIGDDGALVATVEEDEVVMACDLVVRIFANDRVSSAGPVANWAQPLLCLVLYVRPSDATSHEAKLSFALFRDRASAALLEVVRKDAAWSKTLHDVLLDQGIAQLAAAAQAANETKSDVVEGDGASGRADVQVTPPSVRLVPELLLRGFDGPAVQTFIDPSLADDRKRLLNALFLSPDIFVRLVVGLLLARLLCEPGYVEAVKAESGLRGLCAELASRTHELAGSGIAELLGENRLWVWLCGLVASAQPTACGFAMLLVVHAVAPPPARIRTTLGMQDALVALLGSDTDAVVRSLAARLLLDVYRSDEASIPMASTLVAALGRAVATDTKASLLGECEQHDILRGNVTEARNHCGIVSGAMELLRTTCESYLRLKVEADAWRDSVDCMDSSITTAEYGQAACLASLEESGSRWDAAARELDNGYGAQGVGGEESGDALQELQLAEKVLVDGELELDERRRQLEGKVQEKMVITRSASECGDAVERWRQAAIAAEKREAGEVGEEVGALTDAGPDGLSEPPTTAAECWQNHQAAVERLNALRSTVEDLDQQLQQLSEPLPGMQDAMEAQKQRVKELTEATMETRQRHSHLLSSWHDVLETRRTCGLEMQGFSDCLTKARGSLEAERSKRNGLRAAIGEMIESLTQLDRRLESFSYESALGAVETTDSSP